MDVVHFEKAMALRAFNCFKDLVVNQLAGNYTKNYETWKRIQNVIVSFKEELLESHANELKVIDLGCGEGYCLLNLCFLKEAKQKQVSFQGVDIVEPDVMLATRVAQSTKIENVSFSVGNIEHLKFPDNSFDIIINTEVIEHLPSPEKFVESMYRMLKPGGLAIVSTPNKNNSTSRIFRKFSKKKYCPSDSSPEYINPYGQHSIGHISVKGKQEWLKIFRGKGFVVEKIKRGSILYGGPRCDRHPILFAILLFLDKIFDYLFFMKNFSESLTFKLRKPNFL